jgi:hypothetical protein
VIVIGVDPGLSGACSVLDARRLLAVFDLPTMTIPDVGENAMVQNKVDGRTLVKLLRQHCPAGVPVKAVIEAVQVMPGKDKGGKDNAVQTQGSLLRTLGTVETVLECLGWPPEYANPQTWKRFFGLIDRELTPTERKRKSLECARRLYPACTDLRLAKFHNRAESMLIAHWYRETRA